MRASPVSYCLPSGSRRCRRIVGHTVDIGDTHVDGKPSDDRPLGFGGEAGERVHERSDVATPAAHEDDRLTRHGRSLRVATDRAPRGRGLGPGRCRGRRRCGSPTATARRLFGSGLLGGDTRVGLELRPRCRLGTRDWLLRPGVRTLRAGLIRRARRSQAGSHPLRRSVCPTTRRLGCR